MQHSRVLHCIWEAARAVRHLVRLLAGLLDLVREDHHLLPTAALDKLGQPGLSFLIRGLLHFGRLRAGHDELTLIFKLENKPALGPA